MAQRSILEEIMTRKRMLEKRAEQGKYAISGEEGRSTATDQNTVLRVRACRGDEQSEHVDEQIGERTKNRGATRRWRMEKESELSAGDYFGGQ